MTPIGLFPLPVSWLEGMKAASQAKAALEAGAAQRAYVETLLRLPSPRQEVTA